MSTVDNWPLMPYDVGCLAAVFPIGTVFSDTSRPDEDVLRWRIRTGSRWTEECVYFTLRGDFAVTRDRALGRLVLNHWWMLAHERGGYC